MDIEYYKNVLKHKLTEKRYNHTEYVASKAKELAKIYNVDEDKAYIAGLLHDITKEDNIQSQINMIKEYDKAYRDIEKESFKLYHAISGYIYAKTILKIEDEDILKGIRYHTTGRKNMSTFEKVIFVADSISQDRKYDGVENLRDIALEDLDLCLLELMKLLINKLVRNNSKINVDTFECYNQLCQDFGG